MKPKLPGHTLFACNFNCPSKIIAMEESFLNFSPCKNSKGRNCFDGDGGFAREDFSTIGITITTK